MEVTTDRMSDPHVYSRHSTKKRFREGVLCPKKTDSNTDNNKLQFYRIMCRP